MRASGRWPWSSFRHYALREKESWKSSQNGQRGIGRGKPQEAGRGYCSSQKPALSEAEGLAPKAGANLGHLRSLLFICREPGNVPPVPSFLVRERSACPQFSRPQFSPKTRFCKLEDSAFGWRSGLPLRFKRSSNPPALAAEVPRPAPARAKQNCTDNPPL